jgi:hypothetical protein
MNRHIHLAFVYSSILVLGTSPFAKAQTLYGSLVGNVKDSTEAIVAGASVTLTNIETKQSREATTAETGGYAFATIPPGTYDIKVSRTGFTAYSQTGVVVAANNTVRIDVTLNVGTVSESVNVSALAVTLQTDRADVRNDVSGAQLVNLPMSAGRNYQTVFVTLPGFGGIQSSYNSTPSNPSKALVFNVNGASFSINNTKIDGAQSINVWLPHETAYVPTLEAVDAVNVVSNSFDAETGMAGGAAIYVQTKSGTNDFHGALFEHHDNQHFNAKPFFLPPGQSKPKLVLNDFGGAAGGAIIKQKLFYFGSYESIFNREAAQLFTTVPTAAIKAGDMTGQSNPIYDPLTGDDKGAGRTPFPGQIVPAARIDPIAAKLAAMTPLPNQAGNLLASNYFANGSYIFDRHRVDGKVNWNPGQKFTMFGRFGFLRYNMQNPPAFGDLGGPNISSSGGNPGHGWGNTYSFTIAGTYLASPRFIIDAYWGWTQLGTNVETPGIDKQLGLALGIPGTNGPAKYQGGLPRFAVSNYDDIGTPGAYLPYYRHDPSSNYVVNFNWTHGSHDIRWGVDIAQLAMNHIQAEGGYGAGMGGFLFSGGPTSIAGGPSPNQFNSYAAFLLGLANQAGKNTIVPDELTTRSWQHGLYIRDRWNVTSALTLSYGLRWEYYPMATRADRGIGLYDRNTNQVDICGYGQVPSGCGVSQSKALFGPRIGIAYRTARSLVIRAGYGITYDPYSLGRPFKYNYPDLLIQNYDPANSYSWVTTLSKGLPAAAIPDLGNGYLPMPPIYETSTVDFKQFKRGYIQSWNVTLQKQFMWGWVGQAGYVATRSINQFAQVNINAGQTPGLGLAGQPLYQQFGRTANTWSYEPLGTNQYNALQAKLEHAFSAGFQFGAAYTWSKAVGPAANDDTQPLVQAVAYRYLNRAVLPFDRTQNLSLSGMWELPFGKGKRLVQSGFGSVLLGGWRTNAITTFMTGLPFSVSASGSSLNMPGSMQRADQVLPDVQILGGIGSSASYFDPLAFRAVTQTRFGNAGFYSLRGPGAADLDLSISRDFPIKERMRLQFRFESFNLTNTPHFNLPGRSVSSMVLNPDGTIKNLAGYTQITSTQNLGRDFDERRIQFDLRLSW